MRLSRSTRWRGTGEYARDKRGRAASLLSFKLEYRDGLSARSLARRTVVRSLGALTEIGDEATGIARDAVMTVVQNTAQFSHTTGPQIQEAVEGAIRGSSDAGLDVSTAGADAVEGAIRGAASAGMSPELAAPQASASAFEAITDTGVDDGSAAKAAIVGVITGVSETGGNAPRAARTAARMLVSGVTGDVENRADVAKSVVEGALEVHSVDLDATISYVGATAEGAIAGAYRAGEESGDRARLHIARAMRRPSPHVSAEARPLVRELAARAAAYHPQGAWAWRAKALWRAGGALYNIGGIDLAASLAFFTLLSFFPLVAIIILIFAAFADPTTIKSELADVFLFFFPASADFFNTSVDYLFSARLAAGVVAVVGIIVGANGLFMAANRSVNRIFSVQPRKTLTTTLLQAALTFGILAIFLLSIALTVVFQVALSLSSDLPLVGAPINRVLLLSTSIVSAILPLILSAIVFGIVYRMLPNTRVRWRDATFGAIVAVFIFEISKHVFFWFGNVTGQQNLLYLPFASVILLLIWAFLAGLTFLFGASLTNQAARNRPKGIDAFRGNRRRNGRAARS